MTPTHMFGVLAALQHMCDNMIYACEYVTSQFLINTNILVNTFIKWNFLYSWFYLQNTGTMYMYILCSCTCAITQNYFQKYMYWTNILLQKQIHVLLQVLALAFAYYFQTSEHKMSCTQLLLRNIFYLVNTTMCYTPKY